MNISLTASAERLADRGDAFFDANGKHRSLSPTNQMITETFPLMNSESSIERLPPPRVNSWIDGYFCEALGNGRGGD